MDMNRKLFDYYDEDTIRSIKVVVGQEISRIMKSVNTIEDVNNIDRLQCAKDFIKKRTQNGKYSSLGLRYKTIREFTMDELEADIAVYIDFKLPSHYWRKMYCYEHPKADRDKIKHLYPGIDEIEGFKFIYEENYMRDKEFKKAQDEAVQANKK